MVSLGEGAASSVDAVDDILEGLLALGGDVRDGISGRVVLLVGPLDL